ncbi:MAG: hypothetical protein AB7C89_06430 [Intestinibacillus sp.]
MKASDLCAKALNIAQHYNTYYLWGTFGAPLTGELITTKAKQYPDYYSAEKREKMAVRAAQGNYWAFDCVGLIKSILWGWCANRSRAYGGATYERDDIPDIDANTMIGRCSGVSTDFRGIVPGEAVWMQGHIGIYIGGGKVVEATSAWDSGVQISACGNLGTISGLHTRSWTKHGKLPWVDYGQDTATAKTEDNEVVQTKKMMIDGVVLDVPIIDKDDKYYVQISALGAAKYGIGYDKAQDMPILIAPYTRTDYASESADIQAAINKVQQATGFSETTIDYLLKYKNGDALLGKLAAAMK